MKKNHFFLVVLFLVLGGPWQALAFKGEDLRKPKKTNQTAVAPKEKPSLDKRRLLKSFRRKMQAFPWIGMLRRGRRDVSEAKGSADNLYQVQMHWLPNPFIKEPIRSGPWR